MRTYWLISQTNEHHQLHNARNVLNDKAPDLISNVDAESFSASAAPLQPLSYVKLFQPANSSVANTSTQKRHRYVRTAYCSCETKCIYQPHSDDNVTIDTDPHQQQLHDKTNTLLRNSNLCVCRLYSSVWHTTKSRTGPRSAPAITFRL